MSIQKPTPQQTHNFVPEPDQDSQSWQRADPYAAAIEQFGRFGFRVLLQDGDRVHHVVLATEGDDVTGRCDRHCKGWRFHDGACAHVATVLKADFVGDVQDMAGDIVQLDDVQVMDAHPEDQR